MFKFGFLAAYVALTYYLSYLGMRKTKGLRGFSIGNRDMSPILVGITTASSIASTATFVINPGFVYRDGLSAYLHYGVAAFLGSAVAMVLLCKGFLRVGNQTGAITLPHWIRERFNDKALGWFFAVINLLSITFVVLILVGCAILSANLFGISQQLALILVLLFVFSYVLLGGAYAHAYTNSFQAVMMIFIAIILFASGLHHFSDGFTSSLATVSPNYASPFNPESSLYYDSFSVLVSGFVITFALMMQPHIFTKVLYLKQESDVNRFLAATLIVGFIFSLMLFIGFYARLDGLEVASQDRVVATYIADTFANKWYGEALTALIAIALLAAGMSTLDGILVALSAMTVNDLYMPLAKTTPTPQQGARLSRIVLVGIGILAFMLAWEPPRLVGLFAQKGVYGLAAASVIPIVVGVMWRGPLPSYVLWTAALTGLFGHFILHLGFGIANPGVSAAWAILAASGVTAMMLLYIYRKSSQTYISHPKGEWS
jgi:SSS family solute:Na+ symporter/sodium/pantothenate symporter